MISSISCGRIVVATDKQKTFSGIYSTVPRELLVKDDSESIKTESWSIDLNSNRTIGFPSNIWDVESGKGCLRFVGAYKKRGSDQYRRIIEYREDGSIWNYSENRRMRRSGASGTVFRGNSREYLEPPLSSLWASRQFCGFNAESKIGRSRNVGSIRLNLDKMLTDQEGRILNAGVTASKLSDRLGTIHLAAKYKQDVLVNMTLTQVDLKRRAKSVQKMTVLKGPQAEPFMDPVIGSIFSDAGSNDYYELGPNRTLIYKGTKGAGAQSASILKLVILLGLPTCFVFLYLILTRLRSRKTVTS